MDNWKMISKTETVDFYRGGWLGVWDAFFAVVKRDKRKTIPTPVTCSVWVNAPEGQEVELKIGRSIVMEVSDYCGENLSKTVGGALKIHFGVEP